jgi:diadenosine tetraphosphatase ApaH/serine/threonine PP2A family protein phosphatase
VRIALLSDVHANLPALDAVLAALRPFDAVWQLGDVVGYGPHPVEVIERLADVGAIGVCGNHDAAAIGRIDTEWFNDDARTAVEWAAEQLTPSARRWLEALPDTRVEGDFTLAHGSPRDPIWEYVFSASTAAENLRGLASAYGAVGHTHVPAAFRSTDGRVESLAPSSTAELVLDERRLIVNPGGVGQPRDGDPRACGAVLDTGTRTITWQRVAYPIAETQGAMHSAGLPPRLIERLAHGF